MRGDSGEDVPCIWWDANLGSHSRSEWQWEGQPLGTCIAQLQETCWAESCLQGRFTIVLGRCLGDNGLGIWFVISGHLVLSSQAPYCPAQTGIWYQSQFLSHSYLGTGTSDKVCVSAFLSSVGDTHRHWTPCFHLSQCWLPVVVFIYTVWCTQTCIWACGSQRPPLSVVPWVLSVFALRQGLTLAWSSLSEKQAGQWSTLLVNKNFPHSGTRFLGAPPTPPSIPQCQWPHHHEGPMQHVPTVLCSPCSCSIPP